MYCYGLFAFPTLPPNGPQPVFFTLSISIELYTNSTRGWVEYSYIFSMIRYNSYQLFTSNNFKYYQKTSYLPINTIL